MIARRLERLTREILDDRVTHLRVFHALHEARAYLYSRPIDVVFLDLNLNGQDGFDLLKTSVAGAFHVIIVSAHIDQALTAFEYGVLDFIGKPFNKERLEKAFHRMLDVHTKADYGARYLSVRKAGRIDLVAIDDIQYIKGAGAYAELYLRDGSTKLHDKSLDKLHMLLPPIFERIHKSYIVNIGDVKGILVHEGSKYEVELHEGHTVPVGRTRYKAIREKLRG